MLFADRRDAGRRLAETLAAYRDANPVVVGLPRGGVPVAYEVASALDAPLDVLVVRKVGAPENPEYGIGAVAEGNIRLVNRVDVEGLHIPVDALERLIEHEVQELQQRLDIIRNVHPAVNLVGRTVLLVDDGLATGITAIAAARALRRRGAQRVILAAPVCAATVPDMLRREVDEVLCVRSPGYLGSVGGWYQDFSQTSDEEVLALLEASRLPST